MPQFPSRRGFLHSVLGPLFAGAGILDQALFRAARARAQSAAAPATLFDIQEAAEHTYLALARPAAILNCNAVIYVNARDVLIVDTHSKPSAAAALAAQVRQQITAKPVRYVVITHFHYDHAQGIGAYRALQSRPEVIGTEVTRCLLAERGGKVVAAAIEACRKNIEDHKQALARSVMEEERRYHRRMIGELGAFVAEMRNYSPELPDITFDRDMVIHDESRDLHLTFRGHGHTAGDLCVWCPRTRTLATGDLVVGFIPGMGDGFPAEWPATLDSFAELDFDMVLPGHGVAQPTREQFHRQRAYIEELNDAVAWARRAGRTLEETQRLVTPATLRSINSSGYVAYVAAMEKRFRLRPPGSNTEDDIARAIRGNVAAAYTAVGT